MNNDFLARLVELDTNANSKSNYERCAQLVRKEAMQAGLEAEIYHAKPSDGKPRLNLIIQLNADARETLLLAAHYDVVPAGDGWKHRPFKLTVEGSRAYGRGAADDKGGIFSALSAMKILKKKGSSKVNVKLLVTCDEEIGGEEGLGFIMRAKKKGHFLVDGDAAILVDSGPRVYIGSSGVVGGRITSRGSLSELLSLTHKVIDYSKQRERVISKLISSSTGRRIWGRLSVTILDLKAGAVEYAKAGVKSNIIPGECRVKLRAKEEKIILGKQGHAGYPHLAENAITKSLPLLEKAAAISNEEGTCELVFDLRTVPEEDLNSAIERFKIYVRKLNPKVKVEINEISDGYTIKENHPIVSMLKCALNEKRSYGELGGTDARFFCRRGIPSICFGPISDSSNIHGRDEFVKIKDLELVSNTIVRLCENWKNFKTSRHA